MPSFDDIDLPTVEIHGDPDKVSAKLSDMNMPVEAMIELAIYAKREAAKAEALLEIEKVMRGRINAYYDKLPAEERDTRRAEVGMITYTEAGEKVELKDRDWTVAHLTEEQLRITYKPDLKNMETILKPAEFERHVKRTKTNPKLTLRETPGNKDYHEIDF